LTVAWRPRKPRLHNPRCVREPKAPLKNGALAHVATVFLDRLRGPKKQLPPSLKAIIDKDKSENRELRCDGLESIWMVVYCLLAFMSFKSLRVGHRQRADRPRTGNRRFDLVGVSVEQIAGWCGLDKDTVSHVLTILRRAGYLHGPSKDKVNHINQPWETLASGQLAPLPAIRRFEFVFFAELDCGTLIALKRKGQPAPAAPATVNPESTRQLVKQLAEHHALDGPPDD